MRLRAGATSHVGKVRTINEDSFYCSPERGLFVVCDGMGGEAAGEVASQLAVTTIVEQLNGGNPPTPAHEGFLPQTAQLEAALQRSNDLILEESKRVAQRQGMGTTVVCARVAGNIASLAHVGDSRAYLWRSGTFEQITQDHSLVEEQVRAGLLTREQAAHAANQNILLRALGRTPEVEVELTEIPVRAGDYLLLCSDGLSRMVDDKAIAAAFADHRHPQRISDRLVAEANQAGGMDNITAVVVEVGRKPWWQRFWKK
jgi:protein phosphatase